MNRETYLLERAKIDRTNNPTEEQQLTFLYNISGVSDIPNLRATVSLTDFIKNKEYFYKASKEIILEELLTHEGGANLKTLYNIHEASDEKIISLSVEKATDQLDEFYKIKLTYTLDFSNKCDCGCEGPEKKLIAVN